jgi:hypothetical protein
MVRTNCSIRAAFMLQKTTDPTDTESALIQIILQFQYITGGDSNPMAFFLLRLAAAKAAA